MIELLLPSAWASALINHDKTGLSPECAEDIKTTSEFYGFSLYAATDCSMQPEITRHHAAKGDCQGKQCNCLIYYYPSGGKQ